MWSPKKPYNDELSKQCVSEDLAEHHNENDDFEMKPNTKQCPGYLSYPEFCGVDKGEK